MNLLSLIGISNAYAATGPAAQHSFTPMLVILVVFGLFMYLMIIRPQSKRAKEHRSLMDSLTKGDEIVTSGGLLGKITKVADNFVVINIAENVEITVQKPSVAMVVPKGTIKSV